MPFEHSAGGLVHEKGKVLLVRVRNLKDEVVWTFPKGHLEKGESDQEAALREVEEETGWRCKVEGELMSARYFFVRSGARVAKLVKWYLMEPEKKVGEPDAEEVIEAKWVSVKSAQALIRYPSDRRLLERFLNPR